jgi:hypothetical protein
LLEENWRERTMRKNKVIIIIGSVLLAILIIVILLMFVKCNNNEDKFIGKWYNEDGILESEISKNSERYIWQTYYTINKSKGDKGKKYSNGVIKNGYLVFELLDKYYGFEYVNKDEILKITLFKENSSSNLDDTKKVIDEKLTRKKK